MLGGEGGTYYTEIQQQQLLCLLASNPRPDTASSKRMQISLFKQGTFYLV